jgi:hypothetical protein
VGHEGAFLLGVLLGRFTPNQKGSLTQQPPRTCHQPSWAEQLADYFGLSRIEAEDKGDGRRSRPG